MEVVELRSLDSIVPYMDGFTPFVYRGGVSHWPAVQKWSGKGGEEHLCCQHGDDQVDVAVSPDGVFSGDVRKAVSATVSFEDFVLEKPVPHGGEGAHRLYLAQSTMMCAAKGETPALPKLMRDIQQPNWLRGDLCSVNLWMCRSHAVHSTLHYDGHHNILCVVTGSKTVTLYPPDHPTLSRALPPVYAPSCNHCGAEGGGASGGIDVVLQPGDCLFIPEGFFHKVASSPFTSAVNLWWPGVGCWLAASPHNAATSCCAKAGPSWMGGHRAGGGWGTGVSRGYFARRIFEGLLEAGLGSQTGGGAAGGAKRKREGGLVGLDAPAQCALLRGLGAAERDGALLELARGDARQLEALVDGMDPETAHELTRGWEADDGDGARRQAVFEELWSLLSDGGARVRARLMRGKEEYARRGAQRVVAGVLGVGPEEGPGPGGGRDPAGAVQ